MARHDPCTPVATPRAADGRRRAETYQIGAFAVRRAVAQPAPPESRPRAISQMLELGVLDVQQPDATLELADRVVNENLTLNALRALIRGYTRPEQREPTSASDNRRGAATSVQDITSKSPDPSASSDLREEENNRRGTATLVPSDATTSITRSDRGGATLAGQSIDDTIETAARAALQQAATTLASIASRAEQLPGGAMTLQVIDQAEQALSQMRQTLTRRHW